MSIVNEDYYKLIQFRICLSKNESLLFSNHDFVEGDYFTTFDVYKDFIRECSNNDDIVNKLYSKKLINCNKYFKLLTIDELLKNINNCKNTCKIVIDNINTDKTLSVIELLCNIYNKVELCRLYIHNPFSEKFVCYCNGLNNNINIQTVKSVKNKINLKKIYNFLDIYYCWLYMMCKIVLNIWKGSLKDIIICNVYRDKLREGEELNKVYKDIYDRFS